MFPEQRNEELWSSLLESLFGDKPGQPGSSLSALPKRSQRSVGEALISGRRSSSLELVEGLFKGLEAVLKVGPDNPAALDAASVWVSTTSNFSEITGETGTLLANDFVDLSFELLSPSPTPPT